MMKVRAEGVKPPPGKSAPPPPPRIPFQFRALPCETTSSREISQSAKLLHAVLLDSARRKGASTLTNRSMGAMIGRSPATVKRLLSELEAAGLAMRELLAGGRVRSAVVPFAPGVARSRDGVRTAVAHSRPPGGLPSAPGVAHPRDASIQRPVQTEISDADRSSLKGREDAPGDAAYLRACVAAARRGEPMPPPPPDHIAAAGKMVAPAPPRHAPDHFADAGNMIVPPPADRHAGAGKPMPPGLALAELGHMVRALGDDLKAPDVGRRRPSPARLARMLGEARKRRAGKAQPPGVERRSMTDVAGALSG